MRSRFLFEVSAKSLLLATALSACAGQPKLPPPVTPLPEVTTTETRSAPAAAAPTPTTTPPLRGQYELVTGTEGDKTVSFKKALDRPDGRGAIVIGFDEGGVSLGSWSVHRTRNEKDPTREIYVVCRARMQLAPSWVDRTMTLPFDVSVKGYADAFVVKKTEKGGTRTRTSESNTNECTFTLTKGEYTFDGTASDPPTMHARFKQATFELTQTAGIDELVSKELVRDLETSK